jgi:hypothetical protein
VAQQSGEPRLDGRAGRRVHPSEIGWQGGPALCPAPPALARAPSGLVPSLGASRFLRRRHQHYEPVRRPTSARMAAPASPRRHPPPETILAAPVGPLRFRRMLFMRDPAIDPGGATPSRIAMAHVLSSRVGTLSTSAIFHLSRLIPAPRMTPVYASNPASPRRPQDSVPARPLRLWPDETFTYRRSSPLHDALPSRGVAPAVAKPLARRAPMAP